MNWEGIGRGLILRYYPVIFLGGTEEKHENPQSGEPVSRPVLRTDNQRFLSVFNRM
jgi:hypothetical protein